MAYIVAQYYIGPWNRYDGTGNTDKANMSLFKEKSKAIEFIIKQIQTDITECYADVDDPTTPPQTFDDFDNLTSDLETYGYYNYNDSSMFVLEFHPIL